METVDAGADDRRNDGRAAPKAVIATSGTPGRRIIMRLAAVGVALVVAAAGALAATIALSDADPVPPQVRRSVRAWVDRQELPASAQLSIYGPWGSCATASVIVDRHESRLVLLEGGQGGWTIRPTWSYTVDEDDVHSERQRRRLVRR